MLTTRKKIVVAVIAICFFPKSSLWAAEFDYSDTSMPTIKNVSINVKPTSKDTIEVTLDIFAKRKKNQIAAITFGFQSDLPYKNALEKPYECAFVSEVSQAYNSKGQTIDPSNGRPFSFLSESLEGSEYVEHHKTTWTAKAPSGKSFCIAPIVLTDVRISLLPNRYVWYFDGRRTSITKKGIWYAYSEIWYNFPETNSCDKLKATGNYFEGCGVGNASSAVAPLLESELSRAEAQKIEETNKLAEADSAIVLNYEKRKSDFLNLVDRYIAQFPNSAQALRAFNALVASETKSWEDNGKPVENVISLVKNIERHEFELSQLVQKLKVNSIPSTSITCTKGKLTKKVTAINPKCPAGYKKK